MKRVRFNPRKVLVASAGLATVSYVGASACTDNRYDPTTVIANLMPAPPCAVNTPSGEYCWPDPANVADAAAPDATPDAPAPGDPANEG